MLKHERETKTLSFLIFTGKLKFAKFVCSHFHNCKTKQRKKTSFILLLIKYIEYISLNLFSSDAHFNISDIRKVYTPRQDWWLGGHTIVSSIFSELNADFM